MMDTIEYYIHNLFDYEIISTLFLSNLMNIMCSFFIIYFYIQFKNMKNNLYIIREIIKHNDRYYTQEINKLKINLNDLKKSLQNEHNYLKIELHNNFQDMKTSLQKEYNYMNI